MLKLFGSMYLVIPGIIALYLYQKGIIDVGFKADGSVNSVVASGKTFGWIIAITSMTIAPFLASTHGIFSYLQKMNGIYFIPIFAVVVVGMLTKKVSGIAATAGLISGLLIIIAGYFIPPFNRIAGYFNEYHFLGMVFVFLVALMLLIGKLRPRETSFVQQDAKAVDLTPWKYSKIAGILLLITVFAIYVFFADFSVLR